MNAPFQHRTAGTRDPFAAFVCDEATVDLLHPIVIENGWAPEKVVRGGLRAAVQALAVAASPMILFVDMSECGDPLSDINALAEVCEPGTVVIAAGQVNDVRLYRDLVASGIQDYLLKPFNPDQMREALAHAQFTLSGPRSTEHVVDRPHLMTAVVGVRGGVGASTIATSLGWLLGSTEGRSTALLDLDVHFGTGALAFDVEPGRGLTDAIENPSRIDGLFIERAMVKAADKLSILSAEAPLNQPLITDGSAFYQLQEELKAAFEATVLDLPRHMLIQHPHLLHDVQTIVLVVELTLAGARDTIRMLSWLKANVPAAQVMVLANRVVPGAVGEITRKEFEESIERKISLCVPYDVKLFAQAAKLGKPLAEVAKSHKTAAPIGELARSISRAADTGLARPAEEGESKSLIGKLSDLKSLLPGRKAK
ncbi:MAG: pilus assembly protein CpaE [Sphingomonas oligoaromativorans]|jgi:pilus assembly protein CpaE|uniref:pilus assembly protein CpaE n=1 Tax=Sphingomonas oligoaromativorans TaxID=575322 RepID=UPI00142387BE|nr:pilus assembly protein CpaE [Sphingomonas oligoaromativorans]NIJ31717.1 pilus assembly protein CpaE [Sphingomonas oligoaromativorans]